MHCFEEKRVLPVSAKMMYDLVMDIEAYPAFVPWVSATNILTYDAPELTAEVTMELAGVTYKFRTADYFKPSELVEIRLLSGPFRFLESVWAFEEAGEYACTVRFSIEFEFNSMLLDLVAAPIFGAACKTMVKTFEKRALSLSKL